MEEGDYNTPLPGEKKFVNLPATSQERVPSGGGDQMERQQAQVATTGRLEKAEGLVAGKEDGPAEAGTAWACQIQALQAYSGSLRRCR